MPEEGGNSTFIFLVPKLSLGTLITRQAKLSNHFRSLVQLGNELKIGMCGDQAIVQKIVPSIPHRLHQGRGTEIQQ